MDGEPEFEDRLQKCSLPPALEPFLKQRLVAAGAAILEPKKRLEFTQLVNICVFLPYLAGDPQIFFDFKFLVNFPD